MHAEAVPAIRAFIAEFRVVGVQTIHHIFRPLQSDTVETILAKRGVKHEVAVLQIACVIDVVRIFQGVIGRCDVRLRYDVSKVEKLREEWAGEVKVTSIRERIPCIRPPYICMEDRKGRVGGVAGHHFFSRHTARAPAERVHVLMHETTLLAARRT